MVFRMFSKPGNNQTFFICFSRSTVCYQEKVSLAARKQLKNPR